MYGTTELEHPGVRRFMEKGHVCLAGPVWQVESSASIIPAAWDLEPTAVRAEISRRGWKTITGF